jgi:PilZ domain-containing protein
MIREREPDLRRHPRARVCWPVTVTSGDRSFELETINLSPFGAKIRVDEPLFELGAKAQLHFEPPEGHPLDVQAIVWRRDPDGSAFFFIGVDGDEYTFPTGTPMSLLPDD